MSEDMVNHPPHYTSDPSGVECIQITRHRNFNVGNAIKYLWRAGLKKDGLLNDTTKTIEDLRKSIFYIEDEIIRLENTFAITGARISAENITGTYRVEERSEVGSKDTRSSKEHTLSS